jgi:hypothetical protein
VAQVCCDYDIEGWRLATTWCQPFGLPARAPRWYTKLGWGRTRCHRGRWRNPTTTLVVLEYAGGGRQHGRASRLRRQCRCCTLLPRAGSTGVGAVRRRGASLVGRSNVGGARRFARPDSRSTSDWVPSCSFAAQEVEALLMYTHSLAKGAQWMTDSPPLSPVQGQPQSTQPRETARRCGCRSALQQHPPRRRLSHPAPAQPCTGLCRANHCGRRDN